MATKKDHAHVWREINRFLPFDEPDMDRVFAEHPRDADGKVQKLSAKDYETPAPHIYFVCEDPECDATKQVEVSEKDFEELRNLFETGELAPEHLSQLPLGELIPSLAKHQGKMSGAARVQRVETGGGVQ